MTKTGPINQLCDLCTCRMELGGKGHFCPPFLDRSVDYKVFILNMGYLRELIKSEIFLEAVLKQTVTLCLRTMWITAVVFLSGHQAAID